MIHVTSGFCPLMDSDLVPANLISPCYPYNSALVEDIEVGGSISHELCGPKHAPALVAMSVHALSMSNDLMHSEGLVKLLRALALCDGSGSILTMITSAVLTEIAAQDPTQPDQGCNDACSDRVVTQGLFLAVQMCTSIYTQLQA